MQKAIQSAVLIVALIFVAGVLAGYKLFAGADSTLAQRRQLALQREQLQLSVDQAKAALSLRTAEDVQPYKSLALGILIVGAASAVIIVLNGGSFYFVAGLRKRVLTHYADDRGLFPVIQIRHPSGVLVHDPNRAMAGTTAYLIAPDGHPISGPIIHPGHELGQQAATAQGASVQLARAAVSGSGLVDHVQDVVKRMLPGPDAPALPPVKVISSDAPAEVDLWIAEARNAVS